MLNMMLAFCKCYYGAMKQNKFKSHCPINFAQETFGDRWSLLIIRDLMFKCKQYYGEFLNSDEKISTNILATRLEKLEMVGLITKTIDQKNHSKKLYCLTQKGIDLMPMLLEMIAWSAKYDDKTEAPAEFIASFEDDRAALIEQLRENLNQ
jgi:DNA-binding HxlR family transcriptional regulator